jgi:hypothetical protein
MSKTWSLQDLELFLRVAETSNMSEVARQLHYQCSCIRRYQAPGAGSGCEFAGADNPQPALECGW